MGVGLKSSGTRDAVGLEVQWSGSGTREQWD